MYYEGDENDVPSVLKSLGIIVRVGSNKTGYWKVTIDNLKKAE